MARTITFVFALFTITAGCDVPYLVERAESLVPDVEPDAVIPEPERPTAVQPPSRECASEPETLGALTPRISERAPGPMLEEWLHEGCPVTRTSRTFNDEGQLLTARFEILEFDRMPLIYGSWAEYFQENTYDDQGRLVQSTFDAGEGDVWGREDFEPFDGIPEATRTLVYDGEHLQSDVIVGSINSGYDLWLSDRELHHTYDARGRLVETRDGVGVFATVITHRYEGDVLVETQQFNEREGERTLNERIVNEADAEGRVIASTTTRGDEVVHTSAITFTATGRVEVHESRFSANNIKVQTLTFDLAGNEVRNEDDHPAGGPIDQIIERTFNDDGQVLVEERSDPTGLIGRNVHVYDDDGRLLERRHELNPWNNTATFERHVYDASGNLVRTEWGAIDGPLSSVMEQRWVLDLSGESHLSERVRDNDADGEPDGREVWVFDEHGNLLVTRAGACQQEHFDFFGPCDGPLVDVRRFVYTDIPEI